MNEQLKQFAAEAWNYANKNSQDGDSLFGNLQLSKFSELIIKECARVAFENDLKMAMTQWGAESAILKHFGIK